MLLPGFSKAPILLLITTLLHFQDASPQPHFVRSRCTPDGSGNYTTNSTFQKNLDLLLSELDQKSSLTLSYDTTAGSETPAKVYGLFYCRGDLDNKVCHGCIQAARKQAFINCPNEKNAVIWYQECTLRYYANNSISFLENDGKWVGEYGLDNVSDPSQFLVKLTMAMGPLINQSAYGSDLPSFATREVYVTELQTLYCLVQCSPYITANHCNRCLTQLLGGVASCCSNGSTWVMLFNPSCQLRYDFLPFYNITTLNLRPIAQPPGASPSTSPQPKIVPISPGKNVGYYITRAVAPVAVLLLLAGVCLCLWRRKLANRHKVSRHINIQSGEASKFNFRAMKEATGNFSRANKLGEGGFGAVYKGKLQNGEEVAIKRLSERSGQGIKEFSTEVHLVAKLQHRNLVRLVGYCAEKKERLLVYEYVPNLSLDQLLFDPCKSIHLDWETRYKIMLGIARGLQYLHHESRLNIVHRDLKSSNILLDANMNPKIADFGLAKLIMVDETHADTTKVAGTLGYMAPEYLMQGRFSFQSDVYSFGIILLEIVSGQSISKRDQSANQGLLFRAWRLWEDGLGEKLLDPILHNEASRIEVIRCIQIALLCVQNDANSRLTMQMVLLSLNSTLVDIPSPVPPPALAYDTGVSASYVNSSREDQQFQTGNEYSSTTENSGKDLYPN